MVDYELENEIADNDERQFIHDVACECPECTGEADYERREQRMIKLWDEQNIEW